MDATTLESALEDALDSAQIAAADLIAELDGAAKLGLRPAAELVKTLRQVLAYRCDKRPVMRIGATDISAVGVYDEQVTLGAIDDCRDAAAVMVAALEPAGERIGKDADYDEVR